MSKVRINFNGEFNPSNHLFFHSGEDSSWLSSLTFPKDKVLNFEYINNEGTIIPMTLLPEEELGNLSNQINLEKIHYLLEKLSLFYESISNKIIAFDIACGKPSYDSQIAAKDRVDKFQNTVGQIYNVLHDKE